MRDHGTHTSSQFRVIRLHYSSSFYCMALLSTMYVSLCYWPPVPADTPLIRPWATNITTFADALRYKLPDLPPHKVPQMIPIEEHCWCDVSSGIFSAVNLTKWEERSVNRLAEELESVIAAEKEAERKQRCEAVDEGVKTNGTSCDTDLQSTPSRKRRRPRLPFHKLLELFGLVPTPSNNSGLQPANDTLASSGREENSSSGPASDANPQRPSLRLPWFRREYDLRRFGFAMVLDFGWPNSQP